MHKVLVVAPQDRPGELARIGEILGRAGINIEAISAVTGRGKGLIHVLVDRPDDGYRVLIDEGVDVRDLLNVAILPLVDEPGRLGHACRRLADAGINIEQAYLTIDARVVIVCEEVDRAKRLLGLAGRAASTSSE